MSASALPYEVRNQVLSKPIVHPVEKRQPEKSSAFGTCPLTSGRLWLINLIQAVCSLLARSL
jgi:hypothetical protein